MRSIVFAASCLFVLAAACGGSTSDSQQAPAPAPSDDSTNPPPAMPPAPPAVDNGAPSTNYPAPHPDMPQLVNEAGGKTLTTPKVHIVTYPAYEHLDEVKQLAQGLGATTYWTATTSEYGVGKIAYDDATELTGETAPGMLNDKQVEQYINQKLAAGAFGTPDPQTIYAIFYPKSTTITLQGGGPVGGGTSCSSFGGYHGNTIVQLGAGVSKNIPFAVLPTCAAFAGMTESDGLTGALTHELIEAVTDPYPTTNNGHDSAYAQVDQDHFIWNIFGGSESGDMCAQDPGAFFKSPELGVVVQRTWSNALAKVGHDPCAPNLPNQVYFNAGPVMNDDVTLDVSALGAGIVNTKGTSIAVGKSKTIELDLFSDGPTSGPWTVSAIDMLAQYTKQPPTLDFKFDRNTGVNGEKLHLTITVKSAATLVTGAHPFLLTSKLGTHVNTWPALVTEP